MLHRPPAGRVRSPHGLLLRPRAWRTGFQGGHPETLRGSSPPTDPPGPPSATGGGVPRGPLWPLILGGAKKCTFLTPCGAKSWGSGGAPPTNLILLRNQRPRPASSPRRHVRDPGDPTGPPTQPHPPPHPSPPPIPGPVGCCWWGWWWLVGQAAREGWGTSAAQRREALNSGSACSTCVLPSVVCPGGRHPVGPAIAPTSCVAWPLDLSLSLLGRSSSPLPAGLPPYGCRDCDVTPPKVVVSYPQSLFGPAILMVLGPLLGA